MTTSISRRAFLKATGLTIAVSMTPFGSKLLNASGKEEALSGFKPDIWFEIKPDNKVAITVGASEMGQGTHTALAMIIADELEADWKQIKVSHGPAAKEFKNPINDDQGTWASASVRAFYEPLRKAGAAGRIMLIKAAASTWKVPESECEAENGTVQHKKSGRNLTYGKLCMAAAKLQVPQNPPLKKESEFKYIGKPMPRLDIPEKVAGVAKFGLDFAIPNMEIAVFSRPPAYGAKPISFDEKAAEGVKGVSKVIPAPMGIAVCAESLSAALKGRHALNVKWDKGSDPQLDDAFIEKSLIGDLEKPGAKVIEKGDTKKALSEAKKKVEATYFVPYVAHATMEPMNCTAYVRDGRCDVWVPTQGQLIAQLVASQVSGLPPEKVQIHTTFLGCGLGRRAFPDFVVEAVIASKVLGKPVKVVWTREEDIKYDFYRPAMSHRIEAGLDSQGRLNGWSHKVVSPSLLKYIAPQAVVGGIDLMSLWGIADFPGSPNNNTILYEIPNFYLELLLSDLPIPVAPWRSVQNGPNAFVIESFVDELAKAAGKDPLEFRLQNLKNSMRACRVLETAAKKADWGKPVPKGQGRGIAQHSCFGTYVAQVVDLSVNEKDGSVKVNRVVAAVDCGPVVNPNTIKAQIEGAITIALSTALKEEVKFSNGGVKSANFDDYKIIKMSDIPEIEVHIVESKEKLGGIGEPGVPPLAPAVGNAIFNATGARIRRIPFTPERVLAAIKSSKT
ncbi:MAG: molybdopterin cofactor-binding domain-containing protein [bacterium]